MRDSMLDFIRGTVRPAITTLVVLATVWFCYLELRGWGKVPDQWWVIAPTVITWWFQSRDGKRTGG